MKKSRFSDSRIMAILKQAEAGTPVSALCREHGMCNASFLYVALTLWRYGCLDDGPPERTGR